MWKHSNLHPKSPETIQDDHEVPLGKRMKKFILYTLYIVAITVFFLYYLFPSDETAKYIAHRIGKANPDLSVRIEKVTPSFPPGLGFDSVDLFHRDTILFQADRLNVVPKILSMFGREKAFRFKGRSYGGVIEGETVTSPPGKENEAGTGVVANADIAGMRMENIPALQGIPNCKISGSLNGKIEYTGKAGNEKGGAGLTASDCVVEIDFPLLPFDSLSFRNVNIDIKLEPGRKLKVGRFKADGDQMEVSMTGTVTLKKPVQKSLLRLSGEIKPHPSFMKNMGEGIRAMLKKPTGKGWKFRLFGTLGKPKYKF